ncbi:MAG: PIN domain-containing protein [Candidatus Nanopelagicales bacterium]|nr:PIN domain-containing protein [Candidatus Nanopelagicales bacterium]
MQAIPNGEVFLDTNILVAATDSTRTCHSSALAVFNSWPSAGAILVSSSQVLREYASVATRPIDANGLGLSPELCAANISAFLKRVSLLPDDERAVSKWLDMMVASGARGRAVHDAAIVASAVARDVRLLLTVDVDMLARFRKFVPVSGLMPD